MIPPEYPGTDSQFVADNLASLLQRVAGPSVQAIDGRIAALQTLREKLQNDETRVKNAKSPSIRP